MSMIIKGLQKTTLLDYPGKVACTIFTFGCNFRCGFCHNPGLVSDDGTPEVKKEDVINFLKNRKTFLDGVCISGGEPTIQKDIVEFISEIKCLGYEVKIDTNGTNPDVIERLLDGGLVDYVAMDIKGPLEKYEEIADTNVDVEKIKKTIEIIKTKAKDYEFRMTIVPKFFKEDDIASIANMLGDIKVFYIQQFRNESTLDESFKEERPFENKKLEELTKEFEKYFKSCKTRGI